MLCTVIQYLLCSLDSCLKCSMRRDPGLNIVICMQLMLALVLPFLACVALTLTVGPAHFSLKWSLGMGLLYFSQAALLRSVFLEQEFKVYYLRFALGFV